jgi:uncharacterized protein
MTTYDHVIVGAGPAGLFACYEILKKNKKKKIALIDLGKRIEDRKPNEVMMGVGGAGTYSDGKLHFTAILSHEKAFHLISRSDYQVILDYVDEIFNDFGTSSEYFPKESEDLNKLVTEATQNDVELVVRRARHVGTDKLKMFVEKFQAYLIDKGVEVIDKTKVDDIIVEEGRLLV